MKDSSANHRDLSGLIAAVCDGYATAEQREQLGERLRYDPEARVEYIRYVDLHAGLADETCLRIGTKLPVAHSKEFNLALPITLATAACLLLAATLVVWLRRDTDDSDFLFDPRSDVATLLACENCHWAARPLIDGQRIPTGRLHLLQGTAMLRTDSGAELVLVAPAELEVRSPEEVLVRFGEIVVQAETGAEGFVVRTPTSEVVDLGTEFAVKVVQNGATEVHVLDGRVSYRGTQWDDELTKILNAGEGVAIDTRERPMAVPMNSPRFRDYVRRISPSPNDRKVTTYEGFNYTPGILPLAESTVGIGWKGPWRRRLVAERRSPDEEHSPDHLQIVHGQINNTWRVPGGRLGMLQIAPGKVFYVRPMEQPIRMDRDGVTFVSLMVKELQRHTKEESPSEHLRLTFRSSSDYFGDAISWGHGPLYRPTLHAGPSRLFKSPYVLPAEQTTLWIGKIVSRKVGDDEVFFRVFGENEALGYAEPATWHVVTRGVQMDAALDRALLSSTGKSGRIVDELRIGPTWQSVAPITRVEDER